MTQGTGLIDFDITVTPPRASLGNAFPDNWYKVGLIRWSDSVSYGEPFPVTGGPSRHEVPPWATQFTYSIAPGGTVTAAETSLATAGMSYQRSPWDRHPLAVVRSYASGVNGQTPTTQVWSYTVPTGRLFMLARANLEVIRAGTATTQALSQGAITLNTVPIAEVAAFNLLNGPGNTDDFSGGGLVSVSGTAFAATVQNNDVGGSLVWVAQLSGTEFDQ